MRSFRRTTRLAALAAVMAMVVAACGGGKSSSSSNSKKLVIAGANFAEQSILGNIYADALKAKGYEVSLRLNLGAREVIEQAWTGNEIDFVPEYAGSLLEFFAKGSGTPDLSANMAKLQPLLNAKGRTALTPAPATDQNVLVVTKKTVDKYAAKGVQLSKVSDLTPLAKQMSFAAPSECFGKTRSLCADGYQAKYGIKFGTEQPIDSEATRKDQLLKGTSDVALLFTGSLPIDPNYVPLADDKALQPPDNVVPVVRTTKVTADLKSIVDKVSAALTQEELVDLNKKVNEDKADPADVASAWVKEYKFG